MMGFRPDPATTAAVKELLGYLNYSSGASDPRFLANLCLVYEQVEAAGEPTSWLVVEQLLRQELAVLAGQTDAFRDVGQAQATLDLTYAHLLPTYLQHHVDLLAHQDEADLWRPLFVGRAFEAVLAAGAPWDESQRIVDVALAALNDYLGHRPLAVLDGEHRTEPYPHERVRPIPLYVAGAGVAPGRYGELLTVALDLLRGTSPPLLEAAGFDPEGLDELAVDPRAYDFNHPVNKRPNYHFGQWDPHQIDLRGRYRRFVLQQVTLDAVLKRVETGDREAPHNELLVEAAAVLAGTMLMAAGVSGRGPDAHDSSVTLSLLMPAIAAYRDAFYEELLGRIDPSHAVRLRREAQSLRQPFARARQHLNAELARQRALQLQHVHLATLYARLGYPDAARRQAEIVPAVSARMSCQLHCLETTAGNALAAGRLADAAVALHEAERLLHRAIHCGAIVDPWVVLGFAGQYSLFPAMENSVHDHRVDELLDLMEQLFDLYARLWHAAAAARDEEVLRIAPPRMNRLAVWWDRYATSTVGGMRSVIGGQAYEAAQTVAAALSAWRDAGTAGGDIGFWRGYAEEFTSPQAYASVIATLLDRSERCASMALLMHWLSEAETAPLDAANPPFFALAMRWFHDALAPPAAQTGSERPDTGTESSQLGRVAAVKKFFDYLEANAEKLWDVPESYEASAPDGEGFALLDDAEDDESSDDDVDSLYGAAYEDVIFRDSTYDGVDAEMLEAGAANSHQEHDARAAALNVRLAFLTMLARLWKLAAGNQLQAPQSPAGGLPAEALQQWSQRAATNAAALVRLMRSVERQPLPEPGADDEALIDYDRQRMAKEALLEKVIVTSVAMHEAAELLAAVSRHGASTPGTSEAAAEPASVGGGASETASNVVAGPWECFKQALAHGNASQIRAQWPAVLGAVRAQPLLYVPLAKGGDSRTIAAARSLQQTIREVLRRLPRLGLLRETCQLLQAARLNERDHPQGAGAVTEFDRLFEIGYQTIVESLVESSQHWRSGRRQRGSQTEPLESPDAQLIECLQQITESLLSEWLSHSRTLRLSVLEKVGTPEEWNELVEFLHRYGRDLFTQRFFQFNNLRAILHLGVDRWLKRVAEEPEAAETWRLFAELDSEGGIALADARRHLTLVIEAVVENYSEYRDYNATTTQSDRGDLLYSLLDFLRLKAAYDRIHWNLRPVMMAHEVLVRRGRSEAAELWRRAMAERTAEAADLHLQRLSELQEHYGMRLPTVADRLSERFVRQLAIDRIRALIGPAADEARRGLPPRAFVRLEQEVDELADEPGGAGLDPPDWLIVMEQDVERARSLASSVDETAVCEPWIPLSWRDIQEQLQNWEPRGVERKR